MTRRLAVLSPFEGDLAFAARHPDDAAKVAARLVPWRPDWRVEGYVVEQGHWLEEPAMFDGLVITGRPASVKDDRPWIAHTASPLARAPTRRC